MNKFKPTHKILFRLVAYTDAAGKYSQDAYRCGNEDNFYVDDDLTDEATNRVAQDEILQLGSLGMLMAVADGMGGMNAGEVASQIAIDTVKSAFRADLLSLSITATAQSRQKYLEQVIRDADKNIKAQSRKNSSQENMGSTIIIAWLYEDELTISWCGDSRAYLFNEKFGIRLISQDHSYVQELVNKGLLTYEQTFDHPQNNIVTRSLGDPTKTAKPESKTLKVGKGDIILLCSDGLSGVLRDRKTYDSNAQLYPEGNIEDIIRANTTSMKACREALWSAAEKEGWYDNVTAILCQITDGPESLWAMSSPIPESLRKENTKKKGAFIIGIFIIIVVALIVGYLLGKKSGTNSHNPEGSILTDSIPKAVNDTTTPTIRVDTLVVKPSVEAEGKTKQLKEKLNEKKEEALDTTSKKSNGLTKIENKDTKDSTGGLTKIDSMKKKLQKEFFSPMSPKEGRKDTTNTNSKEEPYERI